MKLFSFFALLLLLAPPAFAQGPTDTPSPVGSLRDSIRAAAASASAQAPATNGRRDSLANGAVIGAVVGGATLGVIGGVICSLLHEEGNPPCWRGTLAIGAIGAGIGAAAGVGIDAMISTTSMSRPTFDRSTPERRAIVINWRQRF